MKRTTSLQATFGTSVRSSKEGSAIFWLSLQHSTRCTKIDRRPVRRPAKRGYADRCSPNVAAHETRLLGRHRWNAQVLRQFSQSHQSISCVLVFAVPAILSPLFFPLQRRVDRRRCC